MKKSITLFSFLFLFFILSTAQNKKDFTISERNNEIEIDITNVIKSAIVVTGWHENMSSMQFTSPYVISYRRYLGKFDIHTGIGFSGRMHNSVSSEDSTTSKSNQFGVNFGVGFSHYTTLNQRFALYYGSDIVLAYGNEKSIQSNSAYHYRYNEKSIGVGLRPFLGVQFYVAPRISLATEAGIQAMYVNKETFKERESLNNSTQSFIDDKTSKEFEIKYLLPLNLKLRVRL